MRCRTPLTALLVAVAVAGAACSSAEDAENRRKARLYDAQQAAQANAQQAALQAAAAKDKQLKDCFLKALTNSLARLDVLWVKKGCSQSAPPPSPLSIGEIQACNLTFDLDKQHQIEEEDRCVKMFK